MSAKGIDSSRRRSRPVKKKSPFEKKEVKMGGLLIVAIAIIASVAIYINMNAEEKENPIAVIDTSMGTIKVELYEDKVPNTCDNFIKLANDGFYDGLVFHRVANLIPDKPETHIIQGGGFTADGTPKESPYGPIDLEIDPEVRHVDGAIAMARTSDPNSATSQFYICDGAQSFLDDNYAAFGIVIDGMDVVRGIASVTTGTKTLPSDQQMQYWPIDNVIINSITIEN